LVRVSGAAKPRADGNFLQALQLLITMDTAAIPPTGSVIHVMVGPADALRLVEPEPAQTFSVSPRDE